MVTTLMRRGAAPARRQPCATRRVGAPRLEALETRMLLSSGLQPTAREQLMLQQLNAIRANPAAYGRSIGVDLSNVAPAQPLAFNTLLEVTARSHSQDMNDNNYFGHNSSAGQTPDARMTAAGFNWSAWGESIAAGFTSTSGSLQGLIVDQGIPDLGHRVQLLAMNSLYQSQNQVGVGIASGSGQYGTYYTIDTGRASGDNNSFATGVVFNDANHNNRYDVGEGLGGVTVTANNGAHTTGFDSGGYSLNLAPGTYTLTFTGGGLSSAVSKTVSISGQNVEVDVTNPPPQSRPTPPPAQTTPPPSTNNNSNSGNSNSSNQATNSLASLQRQFNFHMDSSGYHQNMLGQNEKWVIGNGSAMWGWYAIMPDGSVRPWLGGRNVGASVGNVGTSTYANPTLLTNAKAAPTQNSRSTPAATPTAPLTLSTVADVTAAHGNAVHVTLAASAPAGRSIRYQAQVTASNAVGNSTVQSLNLTYTGNYMQNAVGLNEKWLRSSTSNLVNGGWYAILPDGEIRPWTRGQTTGATVTTVSPSAYADPSQLYKVSAPTVGTSFSGNVLTLTPPSNYVGTVHVTVTASDGTTSTSRQFNVRLT